MKQSKTQQNQRKLTAGLMQAGRHWRRLCERHLETHGISEARASVLIWVGRLGGGVRQVTLAGHIGIEGASLVRLLDQLGRAGLLERREDPDDRRAKTIWLTEEGARLAARIEQEMTVLRSEVFSTLPAADVEAALRVLEVIQHSAAGAEEKERT